MGFGTRIGSVTSDRPGMTRGSDRATASEGTSSPRGSPDPRSSGNAARKGRASGTVSLLCGSGEFGVGLVVIYATMCLPPRRVYYYPHGSTPQDPCCFTKLFPLF